MTSNIMTTVNITDHNGIDITPNFRVMLYRDALKQQSNITLADRQFSSYRSINTCIGASFIESHCTPEHDRQGSLQSYLLTCQHIVDHHSPTTGAYIGSSPQLRRRAGHCFKDEVCINGLGQISTMSRNGQWANCVKKSLFDLMIFGSGDDESEQGVDEVLAKRANGAYLVMSQKDSETPIEADTFDIDARPMDGEVQSQTCRDCVDFLAKGLPEDMVQLKAQAKLLTTAGSIAGGILWIAMISG